MGKPRNRVEELEPWLFLPDTHCPYHDARAYDLIEKVVGRVNVEFQGVVIGGDFPDFYSVSSHSKDPKRKDRFQDEVEASNKLLRRIEDWNIWRYKKYVKGNHEDRLDRYIADKAPEMEGIVSVDGLLGLSKHGWEVTEYKNHTTVGKVYVTHDCGKAGPGAVKDALTSYQDNIIINHTHRQQYLVEGNAKGIPHVGCSFGWLGDVTKVDYMHRVKANRDWALGFGVGYRRMDNNWVYIQPVTILNYSCVVEGRLFKV